MKQRIYYLDFLRSFAIMVLLLHSISGYMMHSEYYSTTSWYINLVLNAFARAGVPLFLMISGALILSSDSTKNIAKFYKKSLLHIAVPLVFWNIAYYVFKCASGWYGEFNIRLLIDQFLNCGTEYHLWYLYTIIGIYLIAPFLKMLTDCLNNKQLIWLLFLMLFGTTIRPFINTVTPFYIYFFEPLFNGYVACFMMGYVLCVIKCDLKTVTWFLIAGILGFFGSVILNHINSSANEINLVANNGYSLCHFALASSIFMTAKFIFSERTFLKGVVTALSKASFGIYLTHVAVIDIIIHHFMIDASPIVCSLYIFVITIAVSFAISFVLGKIKYINKIVS